jgi:hypothetical protein
LKGPAETVGRCEETIDVSSVDELPYDEAQCVMPADHDGRCEVTLRWGRGKARPGLESPHGSI